MFIIAHYLFKAVGYEYANITQLEGQVIFVIFGLVIFLINWAFILLQFRIRQGGMPAGWTESLVWDLSTNILVIPLSIFFVLTNHYYSYIGIIVFSLIIVSANYLFKIIRNLVFINNELRIVQEVSASISSRLNLGDTTSNILEGINELVNCDYCAILELNKDNLTLNTLDSKSDENLDIDTKLVDEYFTAHIKDIVKYKSSFIIENVKKSKFITDVDKFPQGIKTMIFEPLLLENEFIGCIIVSSSEDNRFSKEQLQIFDILASQAVIAMENARLYKEAQNKAIKDSLTGLYNQRYFYDALELITYECTNCEQEKCTGCNKTSLIIFDIDHFKLVNDTYGHQTGDKILSEIATIIRKNVREQDIVTRYGGEEFTVILPKTGQMDTYIIADRIRKLVEDSNFYSLYGDIIKVTISGGISEFPDKADSSSSLLAHADRAMYTGSKRQGRNRISTYVN